MFDLPVAIWIHTKGTRNCAFWSEEPITKRVTRGDRA